MIVRLAALLLLLLLLILCGCTSRSRIYVVIPAPPSATNPALGAGDELGRAMVARSKSP